MIKKYRFASWNAENAFGDRDRARASAALERVRSLEADAVYIPEFSEAIDEDLLGSHIATLESEGYRVEKSGYYDDSVPYGHRSHFMVAIVRGDSVGIKTFAAGERRAMHITVDNVEIAGVHHEDYRELDRRIAASAVVAYFDQLAASVSEELPQLIMGDFNAIDPSDKSATPLRLARIFTEQARRRLGGRPDYYERSGFRNMLSLAIRSADMSAGDTIGRYKAAGFEQSDPDYTPTIAFSSGGRPVFKIDHILSRGLIGSLKYSVHTTPVSDHSLIQADVVID